MRVFVSIFMCLFLSCSVFSQSHKTTIQDSIISWNENYKLKWNDFVGKMNPDVFAFAVTSYKIEILPKNVKVDANDHILNYQDLTVLANFYKNQSWTISNDVHLLKHEQLHFDISELFARKIRKRFSELKAIKEKRYAVYWDEYSMLWKACRQLQKQYDLETNHGANQAENEQWITKINALL